MVYKNKYDKGWCKTDSDVIVKRFIETGSIWVKPYSDEERGELLDFLEREGFNLFEDSGESSSRESVYPLIIDVKNKEYHSISNNAGAAAIAGSGILAGEKEFYVLYSYYNRLNTDLGV